MWGEEECRQKDGVGSRGTRSLEGDATAEPPQTGCILFLIRYWLVSQSKTASHTAKAIAEEKMLQMTPRTQVFPSPFPHRTKGPGEDPSLNTGTLSEAKHPLSRKSQCCNPLNLSPEPWIKEADVSLPSTLQ